jgi:hypothetical protein
MKTLAEIVHEKFDPFVTTFNRIYDLRVTGVSVDGIDIFGKPSNVRVNYTLPRGYDTKRKGMQEFLGNILASYFSLADEVYLEATSERFNEAIVESAKKIKGSLDSHQIPKSQRRDLYNGFIKSNSKSFYFPVGRSIPLDKFEESLSLFSNHIENAFLDYLTKWQMYNSLNWDKEPELKRRDFYPYLRKGC